ncbi:peptidyl-prolyl cis-trans fkbp-type domain-containing protein [Cyclospora cayetanensis]|uniref:peptidylprolyl isomerase n=1 Tax=Cyclospora cayetanensis TaxID=88456 RepID=A0A1D3D0E6_9EIME|nr:peptidyl-prolyl cis-trans fkbp-type domain-containing protein [Cyclospora cayetanensis]
MMCGPKGFAWLPLWFAFIAAGPWYGLQRDFLSVEGLPLQDDEEPFPWEWGGTRSAMCEACQAVAELLSCSSRTTSGGISSPCYNTLPYLSKGTKRDPALLVLENEKDNDPIKWLQRRQLLICDGGLEHPRAIGTGDSVAIAASNKGEAAAALCLPSPCASLWGEGDAPALRPSRSSRSLRDSLLFLSLNQQTPGTETLPSGLQLRWLHRRPEAQPEQTVKGMSPCDTLAFSLEAMLKDGTILFSTRKSGRFWRSPRYALPLGWREAAALMRLQEVVQLFLSPQLAYGAKGFNGFYKPVGPFAALLLQLRLEGNPTAAFESEPVAALTLGSGRDTTADMKICSLVLKYAEVDKADEKEALGSRLGKGARKISSHQTANPHAYRSRTLGQISLLYCVIKQHIFAVDT